MPTVNYISVIPDGQDEDYQHPTFAEDFEIPPTPAFNEGDKKHDHKSCPAHKEWCKNRWTFYMPFDLHLRAIPSEGKLIVSDSIEPNEFGSLLEINENWWNDENIPEIQVKYNTLFWTEEKHGVWIEYTSHPRLAETGITLVPGTFPISSWMRSLPIPVTINKLEQDIWIKRGTPLFHVRFYDKRGSTFKLRRKAPTKDRLEQIKQDKTLKSYMRFASWDLIKKRESKCPFKNLF
jgi:hypothetical protein|tara:strand:+ start:143 stop:847 length:705 start_codon:yes stop_codon:yes gene_type:complete